MNVKQLLEMLKDMPLDAEVGFVIEDGWGKIVNSVTLDKSIVDGKIKSSVTLSSGS